MKIPAPTDPTVRFVLEAIADELIDGSKNPNPEAQKIGFTEGVWMIREYLSGELIPSDIDNEDVFMRVLDHFGWEDWRG